MTADGLKNTNHVTRLVTRREDSSVTPVQDNSSRAVSGNLASEYLITGEAAAYLRKSASWLLHQHDIPYLSGNPNVYRKSDLDAWFERAKTKPKVV